MSAAGQSGSLLKFGNAPLGSPLGNQQLNNLGNMNGNNAVSGSLGRNTFQGFQYGASPIATFNNGPASATLYGLYGGASSQGLAGQNYFPNNSGVMNNNNSTTGNNNNYPYNNATSNNNMSGSEGTIYGFNSAPYVTTGYAPAPLLATEQSAAQGRFEYGWW
jgi:hypothetical protein